jgi:succinyl-diaminopimelate desuccinylase
VATSTDTELQESLADGALLESLAERTLALCAARSPIGEEAALCSELEAAQAAHWPGAVQRIGNSLVLGRVTGGKPALALFGHLDTVPLQPGDFPARREGGRVYGRGASDMKGAVAVMLELFERLGPEGRARLPVEPVVVLYDREEGPYEESGLMPVLEARPDLLRAQLALCLEPTDLALQVGCCGSMHATLSFHGRAAHSARPWQGENAVHKAGALLAHLQQLAPHDVVFRSAASAGAPGAEVTFREVLNVTRIEGFTGRNVLPAACSLNLNYRFAPGRSLASAEGELQALAQRFGADCKVTDRAPAGPVTLDEPLLRRLRALCGGRVEPKQAWTDVARLGALGLPAANFGPGVQAQAHQKGEWCGELALLQSYRILENLVSLTREGGALP